MNVPVSVEYDDISTERSGKEIYVDGVRATCSRCGNQEECPGTDTDSVERACSRLMISCPRREQNHYYAPEA